MNSAQERGVLRPAKGDYALIGAPDDKPTESVGIGAAWVFTRTGTTWAQQGAKLIPTAGQETGKGEFGYERGALGPKAPPPPR